MTSLARRALLAAGVLIVVSYASLVFFMTKFGTGATPYANGVGQASSRWWHWTGAILHGNLSSLGGDESYTWQAFGHTAALLGLACVFVVVFASALAVFGATRPGSPLDLFLRTLSYVAWGVPAFVLALVLWKATSIQGWPGQCATFGYPCAPGQTSGTASAGTIVTHLALPAACLAVSFVGLHARYLRSSLLVALHAPYTTTARAKGLPERRVIVRHALRNALPTFLSALLLDFGAIFGAALAVDYVFKLNGVGTLFIYETSAITGGPIHYYAVTLLLTLTAALVLLASFTAETAVSLLDPRARVR